MKEFSFVFGLSKQTKKSTFYRIIKRIFFICKLKYMIDPRKSLKCFPKAKVELIRNSTVL